MNLVDINFVENCKVENVSEEEAREIISDIVPQMIEILEEKDGLGLAAPQVGIAKNFFIARNVETNEFQTYFNARYFKDGKTRVQMQESCLSYPNQEPTNVKRFKRIKLMYDVFNGDSFVSESGKFSSPQSIILQHESDHCGNGTSKPKTIYMK